MDEVPAEARVAMRRLPYAAGIPPSRPSITVVCRLCGGSVFLPVGTVPAPAACPRCRGPVLPEGPGLAGEVLARLAREPGAASPVKSEFPAGYRRTFGS